MLAMGPAILIERPPPAPIKVKPILSISEPESDNNESISDFSASESSEGELLTSTQAQNLWEHELLANFGLACATVSNDIEFDRLNNKLLVALKQFSTSSKVYCKKCKLMTQMTKRVCMWNPHTISGPNFRNFT